MTHRFAGPAGALVFFEPSRALPLVHLSLSLRSGSVFDPEGYEGLARLSARMLRMGTRSLSPDAVEDRIDALGGHLSITTGLSYTHVAGSVVARNVDPFFALLSELLSAPAFRSRDLAQLKRETLAALRSIQDDDGALAARHFRTAALPGHPYGRSVAGSIASVKRVDRKTVLSRHAAHWVGSNVVVGISGPMSEAQVQALVERHLGWLARGKRPRRRIPATHFAPGRRLLIVDKPDRSQTQVLIGTLGTRANDPDHVPLAVANTAFGGLFTSRLTNEVRAKRGWSYGASSGLGQQPARDLWSMRTAPAAKDAAACIGLQLELLHALRDAPLSAKELKTAKDYLVKSMPFDFDTASKRLDHAVDQVLFELPEDYRQTFVPKVKKVTRQQAHQAVRKRLSGRNQLIVVVATEPTIGEQLRALPGLTDVRVVPYDKV